MTSTGGNAPAARRVRARRGAGLPPALLLELSGMGLTPPADWDDKEPCAVYFIVNISRWGKAAEPCLYIGSHALKRRETWSRLRYRGSGRGVRSWKTDEVMILPLEAAPTDGQPRWDVESAWLEAYGAAADPLFANATNIAGGFTTELMAEIHAERDDQGRSLHSMKLHAAKDEEGRSLHMVKIHAKRDKYGRSLAGVKSGYATAAKRHLPPEIYERRGELYGKVDLLRDDFRDKKNRRERVASARAHQICCLSGLPLMRPLTRSDLNRGRKILYRSYDIVLTDRGVALASVYNHLVATPPDGEADGSVPKARGKTVFKTKEEQERRRAVRRAAQRAARAAKRAARRP